MKRALLVGIDAYPFGPLQGCVNDATAMAQVLERDWDGAPNFSCKLITSPGHPVSRSTLMEEIDHLFTGSVDVSLFFFAGHGTENDLGGYLVTPDATKYSEGVSMAELLQLANRSKAKEVVIILDCCNSGHFGTIPATENQMAQLREGVSVLAACRSTETAAEIAGGGLFTGLIVEALRGGAADIIGDVTVAGVYAYADQFLGPWQQRPLFKSHVATLKTLRRCEPHVPIAALRNLPKYFATPTSEFKLDPSFEPEEEPYHAEHHAIFKELQSFRDGRLLHPVGEEHLYYAALRARSCCLTPLGQFYWKLVKAGRL